MINILKLMEISTLHVLIFIFSTHTDYAFVMTVKSVNLYFLYTYIYNLCFYDEYLKFFWELHTYYYAFVINKARFMGNSFFILTF